MINAKRGLRVLRLAMLTTLGVMAFVAAGAQAQLPGESKAGTFTINLGAALLATLTGHQERAGKLLVAGRNLDINCNAAEVLEGKINSSTEALVGILFLECTALEHNTNNPLTGCNIIEPVSGLKGAIRALGKFLPILHGVNTYVLAEPEEIGGNLAVVTFESGKGCVLPLSNPVKGSVTTQVISGLEGSEPLLTFSQAIQELTGDKLLFGTFPAFMNSSFVVKLTGNHIKLGIH